MARGRLRVYLGAAPGVGKTYAMLGEGRRRLERGTDVVVGFVETHGRLHTAEMTEGLEIVPRRELRYREAVFAEMDVDAVLARRPAVALVDELAHTNVPGLRNEAKQKFGQFTPRSLGQALRISGITPADVTVLAVHLERNARQQPVGSPAEK